MAPSPLHRPFIFYFFLSWINYAYAYASVTSPNFDAVSLPILYLNHSELLDCPPFFPSTLLIPSAVILMEFMHSLQTDTLAPLHFNQLFSFPSLRVAQSSFQYFPRHRLWCVIITTRYHLMLQSTYQKTAQSPVRMLVSISWHNRLPEQHYDLLKHP